MADVFISYAREDREQAEHLARALNEEGLKVWWDVESLRSGSEPISQSIDKALQDAKRVLVLWSADSTGSKWVNGEALRALNAGKLHSVWLADDVSMPVPFNASHARNLSNWDGSPDFPEFRRLLADIQTLSKSPEGDGTGKVSAKKGAPGGGKQSVVKGRRRILPILLGLAAPTAIALVVTLVLMQWHRPTRVKLALTVDRVALTVASTPAEGSAELMDSGRLRLVHAERVARVSLAPPSLEVADEAGYDRGSGRFPEVAWRPLAIAGETVLKPFGGSGGLEPNVILQPEDAAAPGLLKVVRAQPGTEAVMELGMEKSGHRPWVTLDLAATPAQVDLVFPGRFLLFADSMALQGVSGETAPPVTLSLRAPRATNTLVSILGSARGLVLQVEPVGTAETLLAKGQIPVSAVDFTRQGPTGERRSTLVGPGSLSYPDLPAKGPLALAAAEFVSLGGLDKARIESIGVDTAGGRVGLTLILDAVASGARVGTPDQPWDARLTWFDWLWHQPTLASLFAIALWFFSTTLAGYKLWQALRASPASS